MEQPEFFKFRIDPGVRERAARVCARLNLELEEVLRQFVQQIDREGKIPFDVDATATEVATARTWPTEGRLWAETGAQIEADVALSLLARYIAECSAALDAHGAGQGPERKTHEELSAAREKARHLHAALDVTDREAVRAVLRSYGPLVGRLRK